MGLQISPAKRRSLAAEVPGSLPWGLTHYLALFGSVMVLAQAWVWVGWLARGPHEVTRYREPGSVAWWAARSYEVVFGVLWLCLMVWVARRCLRERRFTFDAKLVLASYSVIWLDAWINIIAPIWMYSSNWINLNNPLSAFPLAINPDIGRLPLPLLFHAFCYPLTTLGAGLLVCFLLARMRARWPSLSNAQLLLLCVGIGIAFDIAFEAPIYKLRLWAFPGSPDELALFSGESTKFPVWEMIPAGIAFASFGALRFFKDDRGRPLTERGLEGASTWKRSLVSLAATIGVVHLVWLASTSGLAVVGFYADPYKPLPYHLINDMCDAPVLGGGQVSGTRYGPCPEQGRRIPTRFIPEQPPRPAGGG